MLIEEEGGHQHSITLVSRQMRAIFLDEMVLSGVFASATLSGNTTATLLPVVEYPQGFTPRKLDIE